jgi:hypothetical protein
VQRVWSCAGNWQAGSHCLQAGYCAEHDLQEPSATTPGVDIEAAQQAPEQPVPAPAAPVAAAVERPDSVERDHEGEEDAQPGMQEEDAGSAQAASGSVSCGRLRSLTQPSGNLLALRELSTNVPRAVRHRPSSGSAGDTSCLLHACAPCQAPLSTAHCLEATHVRSNLDTT